MTQLPSDYTRCMGLSPPCPQRDTCARHRDIPDTASISWVRNLNTDGVENCSYFIEFNDN